MGPACILNVSADLAPPTAMTWPETNRAAGPPGRRAAQEESQVDDIRSVTVAAERIGGHGRRTSRHGLGGSLQAFGGEHGTRGDDVDPDAAGTPPPKRR